MLRLFGSPARLLLSVLIFSIVAGPMDLGGAVSIPSVAGPLKERIKGLYPTRERYLGKFNGMVDSMVKERFLTQSDGERIKKEAEKVPSW